MRWLVVIGSMAIATGSDGFASELPRKIKPVVVWTGTDSKQTKDSFARCCSVKDWLATWITHRGKGKPTDPRTCPEVDFASYMVIAVFRKTSQIHVCEMVEEKDCVRVRYQPWGNQLFFLPASDGSTFKIVEQGRGELDLAKPYLLSFAFAIVPKVNKALVLEEDVQDLIGKPPLWKEQARFPVLVEK
jgi:hypothetical protein